MQFHHHGCGFPGGLMAVLSSADAAVSGLDSPQEQVESTLTDR